ncbi:MAG: hypothetical protein IJ763_05430 [Lachnospiraceae bacterium]|nr:hypothetical protein [Lachnospiraceae bacterium]
MKNKNNSLLYGIVVVVIVVVSVFARLVGGSDNSSDNDTTSQTTEITVTEKGTEEITEGKNASEVTEEASTEIEDDRPLTFRNSYRLDEHYEKHGIEMGFASAAEYEAAAKKVVLNPDSLHKIEAEDGDDVYYLEETNEFVIVSTDGYIRTYFNPSGGIDYYNRQ